MVEVAVAVILRPDGSFLLARRPEGKVYAGYWEFPGGKIETGEPPEAALSRELHEELGIDVQRAYPWITRVFTYPHAIVRLNFFRVLGWSGEPHPRERQEIRWQRLGAPIAHPMLPANAPILAALELPHEYAITTAETLGPDAMLERLEHRLAAGLRLVQLRDKGLAAGERAEFARRAVALTHHYGARMLVNTDIALARAIGADGVHYTAHDLLSLSARTMPKGLLTAASCHDGRELEQAMELELDFVVLGPVDLTASHLDAKPLGWKGFAAIARGASLPVYAIGGMGRADLERAWSSGAHGIAMIRGAWG